MPIPPPPSGSIVTTDPLASQQSGSIPPPPSGSAVSIDPHLTTNPNGEGVYQMSSPSGTIGVPYSKVPAAQSAGLSLSKDDNDRYLKDAGAAHQSYVTKFLAGVAHNVGLPTSLDEVKTASDAKQKDMSDHPIRTLAESALGPAAPVIESLYGGAKRSASEVGKAYDAAKEGNGAGVAQHVITAVPIVGSAMNEVANDPNVGGTGSYAGDLKSVVSNPDAMGTLTGAAAQAAPLVEGAMGRAPELPTKSPAESAPVAEAVSPVDAAVNKQVAKVGIDPGVAAQTPEEIAQVKENARNDLHQSLQDAAAQAVKDTPTAAPYQAPSTIRDVMGQAARNVYQSAKADYAALDEASGGRWQRFDDQIKAIHDKVGDVTDDEEYDKWAQKLDAVEAARDAMVKDMVAKGEVDPAIADRATASYKKAMALQEVDKAVKMATERVPASNGSPAIDRINPDKLSPRLQKLNDIPINGGASRLEQALGESGAQGLVDSTDATRLAMTIPATDATGQAALKELLRGNTSSNPAILNANATKVDWEGVLSDLDKLGDKAGQTFKGGDLQTVRNFVVKQIRAQKTGEYIKSLAKVAGKAGLYGSAAGGGAYELYHNLTSQ